MRHLIPKNTLQFVSSLAIQSKHGDDEAALQGAWLTLEAT